VILKSTAASTLRFLWRDYAYRFPDAAHAMQFLSGFKADPVAMAGLRRLLAERDWLHTPARMSDDDVLKTVAALLGRGELVAGVEWKPRVTAPVEQGAAGAPAGAAPSREPAADEPEPNSFGASHDGAAQAAALIAAAEAGVPFCEECERAAQAQAHGGAQ
jgi:hypothetical protein